MVVGLTGGIASGKSTVSKMFVEHGALLVDADQAARIVVEPGQPAYNEIVQVFGQVIVATDGSINRKELGKIVFANEQQLKRLEAITHPAIRAYMLSKIEEYKKTYPTKLIIVDVPLLYETKQEHLYEGVIVVYVDKETQISRLMVRNGMSEIEAKHRISLQMSIEEKKTKATWIINNCGSYENTLSQVQSFMFERNTV